MGAFSIWHLLIVVVFVVLPMGIAALVCRLANPERRLGRRGYVLRIMALFVAGVVFNLLQGTQLGVAFAVLVLVSWGLIPYWSGARLYDMGSGGQYTAVWANAPVVGFFYLIYLMFPRSAERQRLVG